LIFAPCGKAYSPYGKVHAHPVRFLFALWKSAYAPCPVPIRLVEKCIRTLSGSYSPCGKAYTHLVRFIFALCKSAYAPYYKGDDLMQGIDEHKEAGEQPIPMAIVLYSFQECKTLIEITGTFFPVFPYTFISLIPLIQNN
jgi:hypothetical protein